MLKMYYPKFKGLMPSKNGTVSMEFDAATQGVVVKVIERNGHSSKGVEVPLVQLQGTVRTMAEMAVHANEHKSLVH